MLQSPTEKDYARQNPNEYRFVVGQEGKFILEPTEKRMDEILGVQTLPTYAELRARIEISEENSRWGLIKWTKMHPKQTRVEVSGRNTFRPEELEVILLKQIKKINPSSEETFFIYSHS